MSDTLLGVEEFQTLSLAAGGQILLPNLNQLVWHVLNDAIFLFISLFLAPNIKEIHLLLNASSAINRHTLLASLPFRYPSLTHINIADHCAINSNIISTTICRWNELRYITVGSLTADALRHVATLPLLENLTLRSVLTMTVPIFLPSRDNHLFPSLRTLSVTAQKISSCLALVEMMSSPRLYSVHFKISTPSTLSQRENLFKALHDHCNHHSLTSITMDSSGLQDQIHQTIHKEDLFKPLYVFSNLMFLDLRPDFGFYLSQEAVGEMVSAWPRIRTLIMKGHFLRQIPRLSLSGLALFVRHCAELQHLSIAFNASTPLPPTPDPQGFQSNALTHLDVQFSPIVKPLWVATFLSDIFPRLSTIECGDRYSDSKSKNNWLQAQQYISVLASIRSQERNRKKPISPTSS